MTAEKGWVSELVDEKKRCEYDQFLSYEWSTLALGVLRATRGMDHGGG